MMITYICPDVKTISPPHIPSAVVNFGIFWACGRLKWAHLDQRWIIFLAHVRCCLREAKSYKLNVYQIKDSLEQDVSIGIYLNLNIANTSKTQICWHLFSDWSKFHPQIWASQCMIRNVNWPVAVVAQLTRKAFSSSRRRQPLEPQQDRLRTVKHICMIQKVRVE